MRFLHHVVEIFSSQRLEPPLATAVPAMAGNNEVVQEQSVTIAQNFYLRPVDTVRPMFINF